MHVMYARDGVHPEYRNSEMALDDVSESVRSTLLTAAKRLAHDLAVLVRCKPVYLVGAGPGDARLFTEKGLDCVRKADVIVYDNLISGSILNEARLDAELIYAAII